jgi:hypothetical protein
MLVIFLGTRNCHDRTSEAHFELLCRSQYGCAARGATIGVFNGAWVVWNLARWSPSEYPGVYRPNHLCKFNVHEDDEGDYVNYVSTETWEALGQMPMLVDLQLSLGEGCHPGVLGALTGLTRLSITDGSYSLASFPAGIMSSLQHLDWVESPFERENVNVDMSVLSSATKLTFLRVTFDSECSSHDLQATFFVVGLSNLRSLDLMFHYDKPRAMDYGVALAALPGLTNFMCWRGGVRDDDLRRLTCLTSLRFLKVCYCRLVTGAVLPDLVVLTNLNHLELSIKRVRNEQIEHEFRRPLNVPRVARGWPPTDILLG